MNQSHTTPIVKKTVEGQLYQKWFFTIFFDVPLSSFTDSEKRDEYEQVPQVYNDSLLTYEFGYRFTYI